MYGNRRLEPGGDFRVNLFLETGATIAKTIETVEAAAYSLEWSPAIQAYNVTYAVTKVGTLVVYVTLGPLGRADHVQLSPFRVTVSAAPTSPTTTYLLGLGLNGAVVRFPARFTIQASDGFRNKRTVGGDPFLVTAAAEVLSTGGVISISTSDNQVRKVAQNARLLTALAETCFVCNLAARIAWPLSNQ